MEVGGQLVGRRWLTIDRDADRWRGPSRRRRCRRHLLAVGG